MTTKEKSRGQRTSEIFRSRAGLPARTSNKPVDALAEPTVLEQPVLTEEKAKPKKAPAKKTAAKKTTAKPKAK